MPSLFHSYTYDNDEELVEILDQNSQPFMVVALSQAEKQNLYFRIVIALLHNATGLLYLQKRSKHSLFYPEQWDVGFTHIKATEASKDAAYRCLYQDLGVRATHSTCIHNAHSSPKYGRLGVSVFRCLAPSTAPAPDHKNIDSIICVNKMELNVLINEFPDQIAPALRFVAENNLPFT